MEHRAIQREILGPEEKYWNAMKTNDVETAVSLTRFPCTVVGPQGARRISEEDYRQMMKSNKPDHFKDVEIENAQQK